jgi:uncharacterized protein YwqG
MTPEPIRRAAEQIESCFAATPELAGEQETISSFAEPCIVQKAVAGMGLERACRFGGDPIVPAGTAWPYHDNRPMSFVGQLNFAELAEVHEGVLPDLPTGGILAFFADLTDLPGGGYKPEHRALWHITYAPPDSADIALAAPPFVETDSYEQPPPPCTIESRLSLSLPDLGSEQLQYLFLRSDSSETLDAYRGLYQDYYYQRFREGDEQDHQVCGQPNWVQHDTRATAELVSHGISCGDPAAWKTPEAIALRPGAADWQLLWQLGSDYVSGFYFAVCGSVYILIRKQDLRARAFDKCWVDIQYS